MQRRTMVQNALWLTGSALLLRTVSMLFQVYLSGRMGAAGLGLMQLVLTATGFATTLAFAGGKISAMYLVAQSAAANDLRGVCSAVRCCLLYALSLSLTVALLLWTAAPWIAAHFVQDSDALLSLRAYAALLPGICMAAVMCGYCTARGKVRRQVLVELLERFLSIGLTVLLLRRADGSVPRSLFAIVAGGAAPASLSFLLLFGFYLRERRCMGGGKGKPMLRRLLRISMPLALGDCLREGLNTVEQFLIPYGFARSSSRYLGLAAYGTIRGMVFPVMLFPSAILYAVSDLLVPELSRCMVLRRMVRVQTLVERCLRLCSLFAAAVCGVLFCAAKELGELIYHSAEAGYYLRLFSPMVLFLYLDAIVDGMQKGLGQQVYTVRYNTLTNVLDVVGLFLLLPRLGITGFIITYSVSHLVNFFLSLRRLLTVTNAAPSVAMQARLLTAVLVCGAAAACLPQTSPLPGLMLRGGVYLALLLLAVRLFRIDRRQDLRWLRRSVKAA